MKHSVRGTVLAAVIAVGGSGCAAGGASGPASAPAPVRIQPYTEADVEFMTMMIPHHNQATLISSWAPSHGASAAIQRLTERIVVGQEDDIFLMKQWLRERGHPDPDSAGHSHHAMHMAGMLSEAQLAELDAARGAEFDRLFLTFMIQHHQGALTMVRKLMDSPGAAQEDFVFKLASEINAEQVTEIERMKSMLASLPSGENSP